MLMFHLRTGDGGRPCHFDKALSLFKEFHGSDQERTNENRAQEAQMLMHFMHRLSGVDPHPDADGPQTSAADIMAHLMHHALIEDWDFGEALESARGYFIEEKAGSTPDG